MICLDTHILIWGVRGFASPGQEAMIGRARRYIQWLRLTGRQVMIPAPVVAEYLVDEDPARRREGGIFEVAFEMPPFDLPAAALAAEIHRDRDLVRFVRESFDRSRQAIKTDVMILAIAIHRQADALVTHDVDILRRLARGRIEVVQIPEIPANVDDRQADLFGED